MASAPPLFDLFQELRVAGMKLTPEQYDLLQQALERGHGLGGWEDLKRVCRLVWVKPHPNYDKDLFERTFDRYVQVHQRRLQTEATQPTPGVPSQPQIDRSTLPPVPPRQMPAAPAAGEVQAPTAVQTAPPNDREPKRTNWTIVPRRLPLSLEVVQRSWRSLRRPNRGGVATEIDLEATLSLLQQYGVLSDVVLRPERRQRGELLLLIDDSDAMLPYRPALQSLITAVTEHRITPAQIYRFTTYPEEYLYDWAQPYKAIPLATVLTQLHRSRTIVIIVSDAGAATGSNNRERRQGTAAFLEQLFPCIYQLLWFNPLPVDRWQFTSAQAIAQALNGRMIPLDPVALQQAAREQPSDLMIRLWSLLPPTSRRNEKT